MMVVDFNNKHLYDFSSLHTGGLGASGATQCGLLLISTYLKDLLNVY